MPGLRVAASVFVMRRRLICGKCRFGAGLAERLLRPSYFVVRHRQSCRTTKRLQPITSGLKSVGLCSQRYTIGA